MPEKDDSAPKIHIDADWKASAQAEKERLSQKEQEHATTQAERGGLPEASFTGLIDLLASQAIMGLGAVADPQSGRVVVDPQGAKFSIDLLGVLEEKTKGNLSEDEIEHLRLLLTELRARFVQVMQLVAQQGTTQPEAATTSPPSGPASASKSGPKIEVPGF